jgi:hypothetical protein
VGGARVRESDGRRETTCDHDGRFAFSGLARRLLVLRVDAAGYRPSAVSLAPGTAPEEVLVPVEPDRPRVAETLTVTEEANAPITEVLPGLARRYDSAEVMGVSSIAASDPLRAVQALPGVAANDEFNAGFAARGSGFGAAGLYIDGVRLEVPFTRSATSTATPSRSSTATSSGRPRSCRAAGRPLRRPRGAALAVRTRPGRWTAFTGRPPSGGGRAS